MKIGSKWIMSVDQSGWFLPEHTGVVTVIDKGQDSNHNLIIYCATEDKRILEYFINDFIQGERI